MTDIVERLREAASLWNDSEFSEFALEAADEIERLRKENKLLVEIAGAGVEAAYQRQRKP